MSCPKCEPQAPARRWIWWAALAVLVSAGAWLERTGQSHPSPPPAAPSPSSAR